jgi:hypothetical protein
MATLYYNAAVDTAWDTLGNWWNDIGFSDPALALPTIGDVVEIYAPMDSGPSASVTLNSIYASGSFSGSFGVNFTGAIGDAIFIGEYVYNLGTINGNATFEQAFNDGIVLGDAIFNSNSAHGPSAVVYGNATFNGNSFNGGSLYGNAIFNDTSYNNGNAGYNGTIDGNATFNDDTYNDAIVAGTSTFYGLATSARINLIINNWNGSINGPIALSLTSPTGGGSAFPLWRLLKLPFPINP